MFPAEIVSALEHEGFSLLIKGDAGTGKTTLALELVSYYSQKGKTLYLATRVSPSKIYQQFPWIEGSIPPENILEAKREIIYPTEKRTDLEYSDTPSFLRSLHSKISGVEGSTTCIVVDSLDALKSSLRLTENGLNIEDVLLEACEKTSTNLVLVSETSKPSKLDYLVDGVIKLEKRIISQRVLRELIIEKLRGVEIKNPSHLFTLHDGRFACLGKAFERKLENPSIPEPVKPTGGKIPTSIRVLDRILGGGFEKASLNILEVDKNVGINHVHVFFPIFVNYLLLDYPFFLVPSQGLSLKDGRYLTAPLLENKDTLQKIKNLVHVFFPKPIDEAEVSPAQINFFYGLDPFDDFKKLRNAVVSSMRASDADAFLCSMSSDALRYIYGSQALGNIISGWVSELKKLGGVIVFFYFGEEDFNPPTHLASSYFKLESIGGNIVFYGENPKTQMYVVHVDHSKGYVDTQLIPIA